MTYWFKTGKFYAALGFLALILAVLMPTNSLAQGNIFGPVFNSNETIPDGSSLTFFGYLDDTDEEIRIESSQGAGYDGGNWFDDFQNYLTEAAGNPYDYHFYNSINGEGFIDSDIIPNNSFEEDSIFLATVDWPDTPELLSGQSVSNTEIGIEWTAVENVTYHIYRRIQPSNGSFFRADDIAGNLTNPGVSGGEYIDNLSGFADLGDMIDYIIIPEDASGNLGPHSNIISVEFLGLEAPIIACPPDTTVDCGTETTPDITGLATAEDNTDPSPGVSFNDVVIDGDCPENSTIERTWTATDLDGNSSQCIQTITIADTLQPTLACPSDISIPFGGSIDTSATGRPTVSDNCSEEIDIKFSDVEDGDVIERTWQAEDQCGNLSTCVQTITMAPYTGPVWYIATDGEDTNDGDRLGPFATIQKGIDMANQGDTVMVISGTFTGDGNRNIDFSGKEIVVLSESGAEITILDCEGGTQVTCRAFSFTNNEGTKSILDGFTILNGFSRDYGAGILCDSTSPTIRNIIFDGNRANSGGAGLTCRNYSSPTIENCQFIDNYGGNFGGAIWCSNNSSPRISGCTFESNTAVSFGGAVFSTFSRPVLEGSIFINNQAGQNGGAIGIQFYDLTITSCTFYANEVVAGGGGTISMDNSAEISIDNSIVAFGINSNAIDCIDGNSQAILSCCDIYGNESGNWVGCISGQSGVNGNISEDPQLCDPDAGNFRISEISPCAPANNGCAELIGAGQPGCIPTDVEDDGATNLPATFSLDQNYPNPFNPETVISFALPAKTELALEIYNINGRRVKTLYEGILPAGTHRVNWDGTDYSGRRVATGLYLYRLKSERFTQSRKMILIK